MGPTSSGLAGAMSAYDHLLRQSQYDRMAMERQYYASQAASAAACQRIPQPQEPADNPVLLLLD